MTPAQRTLAAEAAKAKREALELSMLMQMQAAKLTDGMVREHPLVPGRKFRADFAWPAVRWSLEVDGGTWNGGRHVRPAGFGLDIEKHNLTQLVGWRTIRATSDHIRNGMALRWIEQALAGSKAA